MRMPPLSVRTPAIVLALLCTPFTAPAAADVFFTIQPCRVYDSRVDVNGPLVFNSLRTVPVTGLCGIPANASTVSLNETATGATASGWLFAFPGTVPSFPGHGFPFRPGRDRARMQMVDLGAGGTMSMLACAGENPSTCAGSGSLDVIFDINGYFVAGAVASPDAATVGEDSGATTIDVRANDNDGGAGPFTIGSVQNPSANGGTVLITNAGADLTYQPAANYCNAPPGTSLDTFTYTLSPSGSTTTVTVTVNCVNDTPTIDPIADPATIPEDSPQQTVNLSGITAGGGESQPLQVTAVSDNTGLIPNPTVIYTSPNATGSLQYTPVANTVGSANVTVTVTDGGLDLNLGTPGDNLTVTDVFQVTVGEVNDPPTIDPIPDPAAIPEDSGAQTVNFSGVTAGNGETQPLQVTAVSDNTGLIPNPSVTYTTPNPTGSLQYTPVGNASGTANVTVTVTDGGLDNNLGTPGDNASTTEVFLVTVDGANDPPTIDPIPDPAAINEDAAAQTVNLTGISAGAGEGAQPLQVTAVSDNTGLIPNPSVTYTSPNATGSLQYTPVANTSGTANVTVTVTDGGLDNNLGTPGDNGVTTDVFLVTVNAVNDPPTLDAIPDPAAINEDAGAQIVNLSGIGAGPGESSQPLQVTAVSDNTALIPNPSVTYTTPNPTGSLQYTPVANAFGTANVTVTVTDGGLDNNLGTPGDNGSFFDVFQVVVNPVNDSPTITPIPDPAAINEDAVAQTVNFSGVSAGPGEGTQPLQVTAVSDNTALIPNPSVTYVSPNATGSLQYTPVANAFGTANVTVTVTDGGIDLNLGTPGDNGTVTDVFLVTVTAVNDAPTITAIPDPAAINEDAAAQTVNFSGVSAGPGEATQPLQVTAVSDNTALIPNPSVTYTSPNATGSLQYTPVANAFGTANVTVTVTDGGIDLNLGTPGDNGTVTDVFQVTVNAVNDPPSLNATPDPAPINEDGGLQNVNLTGISAGPGEGAQPLQVTAVSDNTAVIPNPSVTYTSPNATGSLSYTPVANAFGSANITVTLTDGGNDNNLGTPGDNLFVTDVFQVVVNPVNDPPVADADLFDYIGNTELRVDVGTASTPHALETTPSTFGVVDGDSDPVENNAIVVSAITVGTCTDASAPFDCTDPAVGTVHMQTNGRFSFEPAPGDTGGAVTGCTAGAVDKETFTYTLTDDGTPSPASAIGTVTLCRFERVWYVDPNAGGGGNGTSASPLNTLDSLDGGADSDVAGDYVFVHDGTLALSGPMLMENNQHLVGEGHVAATTPSNFALSIPVELNGNGSPTNLVATGARPQLANAAGNTVTVTTEIPVEIVGLSLAGGTTAGGGSCGSPTFACNAIDLMSAAALTGSPTLTINGNVLRGAGADGIDVNLNAGTTGTLTLNATSNTWDIAGTHTGNAVDINRAAGTLNLNFSGNTNIVSSAVAVSINGGAVASTTITGFSNNTIHQNTVGAGAVISNVTFDAVAGGAVTQVDGDNLAIGVNGDGVGGAGLVLATVQGNLSFDDLDVYGGTSGLTLSGTGSGMTLAVTPSSPDGIGTSTIRGANGSALDVSSATIDLRLDDLDSVTSGSGVSLSSVAGQFKTDSDASVSKASGSGTAFTVASSSATVLYGGTLSVTAGSGVSLTSNTGTSTFSGGMTLSTGTNPAFSASGGGTVNVIDPPGLANNTITTTTATAVNINGTTIGASNATFESINSIAAGSNTVINLVNTGAGQFLVTGSGATGGSGGTISNKTVDAMTMNNTDGLVSLKNMIFQDLGDMAGGFNTISNDDAIHGQQVDGGMTLEGVTIRRISDQAIHGATLAGNAATVWNGLTIINSTIEDTNRFAVANVGDANNEGMVRILGIRGTVSITGSTLQRGGELIDFFVTTGTLNMTATSNNFSFAYKEFATGTTASVGGHCVDVTVQSTSNANVTIGDRNNDALDNNFLNCRLGSLRVAADSDATGNIAVVVGRNDFTVNDHSSGNGGDFDFPMGGVLISSQPTTPDSVNIDVVVDGNYFDEITNASGGVGQLTLAMANGDWQVLVEDNTFDTPGNAPWFVRADSTTSAKVMFRNNIGIKGAFCSPDPAANGGGCNLGTGQLCAGSAGFCGPGLRSLVDLQNGAVADVTVDGDLFAEHDAGFDPGQTFEARALNTGGGGTLCLDLQDNLAPDGYSLEEFAGDFNLVGSGSCPVGSPSPNCQTLLGNRNNRGGSNVATTNPPFVNVEAGSTIDIVAGACQQPVGGIF